MICGISRLRFNIYKCSGILEVQNELAQPCMSYIYKNLRAAAIWIFSLVATL